MVTVIIPDPQSRPRLSHRRGIRNLSQPSRAGWRCSPRPLLRLLPGHRRSVVSPRVARSCITPCVGDRSAIYVYICPPSLTFSSTPFSSCYSFSATTTSSSLLGFLFLRHFLIYFTLRIFSMGIISLVTPHFSSLSHPSHILFLFITHMYNRRYQFILKIKSITRKEKEKRLKGRPKASPRYHLPGEKH